MTSSAVSTWRRSAPTACSIARSGGRTSRSARPTRRSRSRRNCPALRRKMSASNSRTAFIKGEKRAETEDKDRLFSERYYGRFERRIPVDDIEADNVDASFKSGVLTVTLPKSARAQEKVKRIAINGK